MSLLPGPGVWAMKSGDAQATQFAGTGVGIQAAVDYCANGGEVKIGPGQYVVTQRIDLNHSNLQVSGCGRSTEILYQPPSIAGQNDRAFKIHNGDGFSTRRNLSVVPVLGATTLTASAAGNTADLILGDWLMIEEEDSGLGGLPVAEIVLIDYVQVLSVAGTTINLIHPMRMDFLGTHSTVTFRRITTLIENVTLRDMYIRTTDAVNNLLCVNIGVAHNVHLEQLTTAPTLGNPFSSYRTWGLTVRDCWQLKEAGQASEFAATLDLGLYGNTFRSEGVAPGTGACTLDYGTAFFSVMGNKFPTAKNAMLSLLYGVHDGSVMGNSIGYCYSTSAGEGITCVGTQRVAVCGNVCAGGAATSDGIVFSNATVLTPAYNAVGNVAFGNVVNGYTANYTDGNAGNNSFFIHSGGYPNIMGKLGISSVPFTPSSSLHLRNAANADIAIRQERSAVNNWYVGPDAHSTGEYSLWFNAYNDAARVFTVDQNGLISTYSGITIGAGRITGKQFALTDAATIAVDASLGNVATVQLTANRTMGAPTNALMGQRLTFKITQDGTGGRTLAWNAIFKTAWVDTGNTLGKFSTISYEYDGTNWIQDGAQSPYI